MAQSLHKTKFLAVFAVCYFAASCDFVGKIISPQKKMRTNIVTKVYEKDGVSFSYPDNWKVSEDEILEDKTRYLTIEDSDSSVFVINVLPAEFVIDLNEHSNNFMEEMKKELPYGEMIGLRTAETERSIVGQIQKGVRKNFTITLFGEKVPHITDFYSVAQGERLAVITIQAPDEDWPAAEPEFDVIFNSLKF